MSSKHIEIRFHGRGGQGIVTASALLSEAFFREGKYPQSVPLYGPQRRGAPVTAFLRVGEDRVHERFWIHSPGYVVVLDDSLVRIANVEEGVPEGGVFLFNTAAEDREALGLDGEYKIAGVDADHIAMNFELGDFPYPRINTLMLAAFSKITGLVDVESVISAAKDRFPPKDDRMETGMRQAYKRAKLL